MFDTHHTGSNLLDALRPEDRDELLPMLEEKTFYEGHVLYDPGDNVQYAYFPRYESVASFHVVMADGSAIETAITGREGAVGGIVSHGQLPAYARSCVMHGGPFYRIASAKLEDLKQKSQHMQNLFARYADCLLAQIFQSVACNATHTIEQRAAKWLLAAMDRTGKLNIPMTQDQLGSLLGVGRSYVSRVVRRMKECGAIKPRRGGIIILDRPKLEMKSCDCNMLVADHFGMVLRGVYPNGTNGH